MLTSTRNYVGPKRLVMDTYYDYITNDEARTMVEIERRMKAFIQQDPDFLEEFHLLSSFLILWGRSDVVSCMGSCTSLSGTLHFRKGGGMRGIM